VPLPYLLKQWAHPSTCPRCSHLFLCAIENYLDSAEKPVRQAANRQPQAIGTPRAFASATFVAFTHGRYQAASRSQQLPAFDDARRWRQTLKKGP
jgi:hypothetical protein